MILYHSYFSENVLISIIWQDQADCSIYNIYSDLFGFLISIFSLWNCSILIMNLYKSRSSKRDLFTINMRLIVGINVCSFFPLYAYSNTKSDDGGSGDE